MAVKIRLRRMGTKKKVSYRFVVVDSRSPRDGRFIQMVGTYNPLQKPAGVLLQEEKIFDWLGKGAVPTQTVHSLFKQVGLMKKWEKMRRKEDVGSLQLETVIKERKRIKKRKKEAGPKTEKEPKPAKTEQKAEPKPEDEKKTQ